MLRVAHILWETVSAADGDYDSNTIVRMRNNVMQVDVVWNVGDELINERDRLPERRKKFRLDLNDCGFTYLLVAINDTP